MQFMFRQVSVMFLEFTVLNVRSRGAAHEAIYIIWWWDENREQTKIQYTHLLLVWWYLQHLQTLSDQM